MQLQEMSGKSGESSSMTGIMPERKHPSSRYTQEGIQIVISVLITQHGHLWDLNKSSSHDTIDTCCSMLWSYQESICGSWCQLIALRYQKLLYIYGLIESGSEGFENFDKKVMVQNLRHYRLLEIWWIFLVRLIPLQFIWRKKCVLHMSYFDIHNLDVKP